MSLNCPAPFELFPESVFLDLKVDREKVPLLVDKNGSTCNSIFRRFHDFDSW